MPIKNIILDLGGVLLDIDYNLTTKAFENLGYSHFRNMYSQFSADQLFQKLEKGQVTEDEFFYIIEDIGKAGKKDILEAWNAMLLTFRFRSFDFIKSLRTEYKIFLLSNTNSIHKSAFDEIFLREKGRPMDDYFDMVYYSHLVGMRKPDLDIFEFVLKDAGIKGSETLFIDDTQINIETAEKAGIISHLLKENETLEEVIPFYLTSSYSI